MAQINGVTVDFTLSPRIINIPVSIDDVIIQDIHDTLREIEDDPSSMNYPDLISSAGKEPLGGGVNVGITSTLNNAKLAFLSNIIASASGTATSLDATGTILTDTGATFITDGVVIGSVLINFTDQSVSTITNIISETQVRHQVLQNGTNNDWTIGDAYQIIPVIQKEVRGGNLVAEDLADTPISPILPTAFNQVITTSSASATLSDIEANTYASNGGIHIDLTNGKAGTTFPIGTTLEKSNNLADARIIADKFGLQKFFLYTDVTLDQSYVDWIFEGAVSLPIVNCNGQDVSGALFKGVTVQGTLVGNESTFADSTINGVTDAHGFFRNCGLLGTTTFKSGGLIIMNECFSRVPGILSPIFNCSNVDINMRSYSGGVQLRNFDTASKNCTIELVAGKVTLDSSCIDGTVVIRGVGSLVDNSVGTTVVITELINNVTVGDAVWDELQSNHLTSGTMGSQIDKIKKDTALIPGIV